MSIFNELKASLEEAVNIQTGSIDAACVTRYAVEDIKAIRTQLQVSQAEFAVASGASVDTIKSKEKV